MSEITYQSSCHEEEAGCLPTEQCTLTPALKMSLNPASLSISCHLLQQTGIETMSHIYLTGCQRKTCSLPLALSHHRSKPQWRDLLSAQALSYENEMFPMWECIPYLPSCPRNAGWEQDIDTELVSDPADCWVLLGTDKQGVCSALPHTGLSHLGELPPPHPCLCVVFQQLHVRVEGAVHSFWENSVCLTGLDWHILILKFQYWPLKNSFDHRKCSILYPALIWYVHGCLRGGTL